MSESHAHAVKLENPRVERSASPGSKRSPSAASRSATVGSASAATARATSSAAGPRLSMRACRSSSRLEGIGSSSPGASVPPRRWSAVASSSAKNGLPREVSQSLINAGRGNVVSRRAWSSSWVAPRLRPVTSTVWSRSSGTARRSQSGTPPRTARSAATWFTLQAGERVAERRARSRVQPLDVVDREAEGTLTGQLSQGCEEGGGHGAVVGVDLRLAQQQRGFESPPLDRRQLGDDMAAASSRRSDSPVNENRVSAPVGREEKTL